MRLFGICLMLVGIYLMAGYPFIMRKHFGHILEPQTIYDRNEFVGWKKPQIQIYVNDNPSRLRYTGFFHYNGSSPENGIVLDAKLSNSDGEILNETVKLRPVVDEAYKIGTQISVVEGALFVVRYPGTYTLDISVKDEAKHSLTDLSVLMYGRVAVPDNSYLVSGASMLLIGFLLSLYRRPGDPELDSIGPENPPKSLDLGKITWGRNTNSK